MVCRINHSFKSAMAWSRAIRAHVRPAAAFLGCEVLRWTCLYVDLSVRLSQWFSTFLARGRLSSPSLSRAPDLRQKTKLEMEVDTKMWKMGWS